MDTPTALDLVSTDDLINQLASRYDHAVFAGVKVERAPRQDIESLRWKGNNRICQGLCAHLTAEIEEYANTHFEYIAPEDL